MAAVVTDQFRILNAGNFVDSISNDSYYVFLGLSNPTESGFGRQNPWNTNVPNPVDNQQYISHYSSTSLFGKKVTSSNVRRVVRRINWASNTSFDMYRHDYSSNNPSPIARATRLYDAKYYVINSDFRVYICIDNGSSGTNVSGNRSLYEPTSTGTAPFQAGPVDDGYRWKYLFTVSPSDIIKFDSTEYIAVPNDWATTTNSDIQVIRDGGNSTVSNPNQIRKVYIEDGGSGYTSGTYDILGDGDGAKVSITATNGVITSAIVTDGGYGYTYGFVNLGGSSDPAKLIPIIPPSKGHGYDIYKELGADKVLIYARFDDSTKEFPIDTSFAQVGIVKNPEQFSGVGITFTENSFSSLYAARLTTSPTITIGDEMTQDQGSGVIAKGYVASFDTETQVLKYFQDRSLSFGNDEDQTDSNLSSKINAFVSGSQITIGIGGGAVGVTVDTTLNENYIIIDNKKIDLGVTFSSGLANPEINKKTGDIIYIDNRPIVTRSERQKEDIKIILEF